MSMGIHPHAYMVRNKVCDKKRLILDKNIYDVSEVVSVFM